MTPEIILEQASASGKTVAEYLNDQHKNRQRAIYARADQLRREQAAMERQKQREAQEQKRVRWRLSWMRMVEIAWQRKIDLADEPSIPVNVPKHSLSRILDEIAGKYAPFGVTRDKIVAHRRSAPQAIARLEYYWRAVTETNFSLIQIGRRCGGRDHTTILSGARKYQSLQRQVSGAEPVSPKYRNFPDLLALIIPAEAPDAD
jgi:hypothetical protein